MKEETEVNNNFKEMDENSHEKRKMIHMSKDTTFNISGGQVNISNDNATISATQNNGVGVDKIEDIIKENNYSMKKLEELYDIACTNNYSFKWNSNISNEIT